MTPPVLSPRQRTEEQLRDTVSMLCQVIWKGTIYLTPSCFSVMIRV